MINHILLEILNSFNTKELKEFKKFLQSPYLNSNKKLFHLYIEIRKYLRKAGSTQITNEFLYNNLYPGRKYNDSTIRNLYADLIEASENYLMYAEFKNSAKGMMGFGLTPLRLKNQKILFSKRIKSLEKMISNNPIDSNYFMDKFSIENEKLNFNITFEKTLKKQVIQKRIKQIDDSSVYLSVYFLIEIISRYVKIYIENEKFSLNTPAKFTSRLVKNFNFPRIITSLKNDDTCSSIANIYISLFNMLQNIEKTWFYKEYRKTVKKNSPVLSRYEKGFHNSMLINYCIKKINDEYTGYNFRADLLEHYSELLENRYYRNELLNYLPSDLFRTILITSLNSSGFEWAKSFINTYINDVHEKERDNLFNHAYFLYYGYTGEYQKALDFMHKINLDKLIYKYDEHALKVKIYYEMGVIEPGLYSIRTFKAFLKNNPIVYGSRQRKYYNFLLYSEKLFHQKIGIKKTDLDFLYDKIKKDRSVSNKQWLLTKIRDLLNS